MVELFKYCLERFFKMKIKGLLYPSFFNTILFCYIVWNKYTKSYYCITCQQMPFLPITDLIVAFAGLTVSIILLISSCYPYWGKSTWYFVLILASISTGFSTFLLAGQLLYSEEICYFCIAATVGFWLTICTLI